MKTIKLIQTNANNCHCPDELSIQVVQDILMYTIRRKNRDTELMEDVNKSMLKNYGGYHSFPFGLLNHVIQKANKLNYSVDVEIMKLKNELSPRIGVTLPGITLEKYQFHALRKVGGNNIRGLIVNSTGSGKSIIIGGIVYKLNEPETLIITPNRTIFNQLYINFKKWFPKYHIGRLGDNYNDLGHITISLFQSLKNLNLRKFKPKLIIVDEAHNINKTMINLFRKKLKNVHYRFGFTATPRKFSEGFEKAANMYGYIGPIIYKATEQQTIKRVVPAKVYTIRNFCFSITGENYSEVLRQDILYSFQRNYKLLMTIKKLALDKNKTALILIDETKQGNKLLEAAKHIELNPVFVHSKINKDFIDQTIRKLNNKEINLVIATPVFGLGTNIPTVDCVGLGSAKKSEIDTLQKIGRGRRRIEGKEHLIVIDIIDTLRNQYFNKYFYGYSLKRLQIYKNKGWEIISYK